ncbi:nucleotidyltransferase substrate binding protein [Gracilinema caldarium]|uniref:Nucleotidyltransferase substrate binding protein, HI0074 family n=1 Tax=Gracilinema caldarium (strain ATCC 51460 / DSM 7334 / H1) TaxID=744872 RepID=F8EYA4_GRAC1|nr:nucleotidyltransferase substrate binding protein [Gracilinema caldarium]AEJ18263.1 nucleotidyltransferase substrate binding protein, HI0074 family [Gracilinema caldarium DSM 7334]
MEEKLDNLRNQCFAAVQDFEKALDIDLTRLDAQLIDVIQNGQVQKFEIAVEICWKTIKQFLYEIHGFDLASPKMVIKKFFELGYLQYDELDVFLHALDIRNSCNHIYNHSVFVELYKQIVEYRGFFPRIIQRLE